jgi:hypothetical protein
MAFIKNENFKTDKPFSDLSVEQKIKEQGFLKGADSHTIRQIDPNDKKSFKEIRISLNEYEDSLVDELAARDNRSRAYILKTILRKALEEAVNQNK